MTEPGGKLIHINLEHVTSVTFDTVIPGARAQLDLTSGKFQGVQEDVEQVMQLISAPQVLAKMTKHQARPPWWRADHNEFNCGIPFTGASLITRRQPA